MALAQSNAQARDAALLRASTELFVQVPRRSADEILRYGELAIHLLPKVESRHRSFVAERLAERGDAPKTIVLQLAKDVIEVAAPILRHSPLLDGDDLLAVIAATGPLHRRLIARREGLSATVLIALANLKDAAIDAVLVKPTPEIPVVDNIDDAAAGGAIAFLALERDQRVKVIAHQASRRADPQRQSTGAVLERLVRRAYHATEIAMMARTGRKGDLVRAFAEGLSLDPGLVNRVVADRTGEGLVLMCKALGLGEREARQVLLLANPEIGRSTETFFRLADLHAGLERPVAERIIATWRGDNSAAAYQPQLADAERVSRLEVREVGAAPSLGQRQAEAG